MGHHRSFRYKLAPTAKQIQAIETLLRFQRELYNAALQERRGAWAWERRSVSLFEQHRTLTGLREVRPEVLTFGVTVCRGTLRRLDRAFTAFYRRCHRGERPGFPRFKPEQRFASIQWEGPCSWRVDEIANRIRIQGIGHVKVRLHRPIRGMAKTMTLKREGRGYWVIVQCVDVPNEPLPETGREVGIDLGVTSLVTTSDGRLLDTELSLTRSKTRLDRLQRAVATKQRGSNRRRRAVEQLASAHRNVRNRRRDLHHKLSRALVNHYDLIVVEDLQIRNMLRRPAPIPDGEGGYLRNGAASKAGLNRSIAGAGWGQLRSMLAYKAESAGREYLEVDPRHTSQRCFRCGHVVAENRRRSAFRCVACGHTAHADVNAAKNILGAGRAQRARARAGSPA